MGACCGNLLRDTSGRFSDRCARFMPCLSDPARRSTLCLKIVLLTLHVVYAGVLFGLDSELIENARQVPWYIAIYYLLFIVTLVQYFITSVSPPGYILDVMRTVNEAGALHNSTSVASKQPASSKNGSAVITIDRSHLLGPSATPWAKLVMDLYPHGSSVRTWTCTYCQSLQPPRTKHCHDCDKCVLEFDHHCVWLGTCIGQGNHCRFWWYICEETALSIWTGILYIQFLKSSISKAWYVSSTPSCNFILILFCAFLVFPVLFGGGELWRLKFNVWPCNIITSWHKTIRWVYAIVILLLAMLSFFFIFLFLLLLFHSYLILTNQTTYELVRRRRIPYLRGVPERVFPFSKGACRNLYYSCCDRSNIYRMEHTPTHQEIEEKSKPYTCSDVMRCRCCC